RQKTPDELIEQLPLFERIAQALGFPVYALPGWEADDVIGTLARRAEAAGHDVYVVTGDKDFMQIVGERIHIWNPSLGPEPAILGVEAVLDRFHCRPDQVRDVLGLMGDTSDNIPGVPKVGEKTALKLIESYAGLDDLYARLASVQPAGLQARLREGRELAYLALDLPQLGYAGPVPDAARALFVELDFPSLAERIGARPTDAVADERAYHVVTTRDEYEVFLAELRRAKAFVLDLETTSLTALESEIVGLAFAFAPHEAWYLPANLAEPIFGPGERGLTARERFGEPAGAEAAPGASSMFAHDPATARTTGRGLLDDPLRPPPGSDLARFLDDLRPVLSDPSVSVIGQNIKYDL